MREIELKSLDNIFKGLANTKRLKIIIFLDGNSGAFATQIGNSIGCNIKTLSEHLRKLKDCDLIERKVRGRGMEHFLTERGKQIAEIIKSIK